MNETIRLIRSRASVRSFESKPLQPEHEQAILQAALRAPTAGNMVLYTILRIKNPGTRKTLSATCDDQPFIAEAPLSLIFLADFTRWSALFDQAHVPELAKESGIPWEGPSLGDFLLCCSDALIAAQNAVIAAQSLGVGSCYVGDIIERYEVHRELLGLPPQAFPIAMLCLGYPKDGKMPAPRPRFDMRHIVHDERYRMPEEGELFSMVGQIYPQQEPAEHIRKFFLRKQGAEFSREMARSAQVALEAFLHGNAASD